MKKILKKIFMTIYRVGRTENAKARVKEWRNKFDIHPSVVFFQANETIVRSSGGRIRIAENTYFNRCMIVAGFEASVSIGQWCAIGYNSMISAITHDNEIPTGEHGSRPYSEADITIGDNVWIGANCYIKQGVTIGDNAIIGANSVVTKDVAPYEIVGGVPAQHIRLKAAKPE